MFIRKLHFTVPLAALAVVGLLSAQPPAAGHRAERRGKARAFIASYLGLTESQKTRAKEIFEAARVQAQPVAAQLKQGHQALREAVKAGKSDAEIDALARQQGALMGQLSATRAKAFAKLYTLLTPEQKDKADQLREHVRGALGFGREFHSPK
jgi:Spy/CpxP family protein refolding chaperone